MHARCHTRRNARGQREPEAGRSPAVLSLVPPHPAAPTPTPFPPKPGALQAPRQQVRDRPALTGVGGQAHLLRAAGSRTRTKSSAVCSKPEGHPGCPAHREVSVPADVKRAARPWSHSWSPHTLGPQMLAQGSAWDPPGEPPGSEGPGRAEATSPPCSLAKPACLQPGGNTRSPGPDHQRA